MKKTRVIIMSIVLMIAASLLTLNTVKAANRDFVVYNVRYDEVRRWEEESLLYNPIFGAKARVYLYYVETIWTNPCPNCKFTIKVFGHDDNMGTGLPFKMEDDKTYPSSAGIGRVGNCSRNDWTLANLGATLNGWFSLDPNN